MNLHQTPSGEKKGLWHITGNEDDRSVSGVCNGFAYWIGGYHNDKPNMTAPKRAVYDGTQQLCPACVEQAYKQGLIKVVADV